MLFQILDNKGECAAVYANGKLHPDISDEMTHTWSYSTHLRAKKIEYARLYAQGKTLDEVCPPELISDWTEASNKLLAHYRAVHTARINLQEHCFYDIVPADVLSEYCALKERICEHVFENTKKPAIYDFCEELEKVLLDIGSVKLNLDWSSVRALSFMDRYKGQIERLKNVEPYCRFDLFGTRTGRLTIKSGNFPILNFNSDLRSVVKPNNDWFVEFDFNAAELRMLMLLNGSVQPVGDVHAWNVANVMTGSPTRSEAKRAAFSWLYDDKKQDARLEAAYGVEDVRKKYWDGQKVTTMYGREIPSDRHHSLSYIIQSSMSDYFMRKVIRVHKLLENKKSNIAFTIHDSIVIDLDDSDRELILEIKEIMMEEDFLVNIKIGKNYGNLKEVNL